jgi:hypothetical protein
MGGDYYICIYLQIDHTHGTSYYELPTICGYYSALELGVYDSDDEFRDRYYKSTKYWQLYQRMIDICLTPRKEVVVYKDGAFLSANLQRKYTPVLMDKIRGNYVEKYSVGSDTGPFSDMSEVIQVTRNEIRFVDGNAPSMSLSNGLEDQEESSEED